MHTTAPVEVSTERPVADESLQEACERIVAAGVLGRSRVIHKLFD